MSLRQSIIDEIDLLAHPSKQLQYERDVPLADVPAELVCGFCNDLYHPKSEEMLSQFTEDELRGLAHLYGVLSESSDLQIHSVKDLLQHPKWRAVVSVAKELNAYYASST
jgi:hypothetical protein